MKKISSIFLFLLVFLGYQISFSQWKEFSFGIKQAPVKSFGVQGSTVWAGTDGQGLYSTLNAGKSWNPVDVAYLTNYYIRSVIVDGDNVYAGTGGGVYLTTDKGTNWNVINGDISSSDVQCMALIGNYLFAGTSLDGVFLTTDQGNSWHSSVSGLGNKKVQCFAVSGNNLYAGTQGGVFMSANKGSSWSAINAGLKSTNVHALVVNGDNLFAGTEGGGIYTSTIVGKTWYSLDNDLKNLSVLSFASSVQYLFAGTSDNGIYFSPDSGKTWKQTSSGLSDLMIYSFAITGNTIYAGSDKRVFKASLSEINPIVIQFVNSNSILLCEGDSIKIDLPRITGGSPPYFYHWKPASGISDTNSGTPMFNPNTTTNYTLVVTDNSQPVMSSQAILTVKVLPRPATPQIVKEGDSLNVVFSASYYRWYKSDGKLAGQGTNLQSFKPTEEADFYVMVLDTNGCKSDTSNHLHYIPKTKSVLNGLEFVSQFELFPNPVNDKLKIYFNISTSTEVTVEILDCIGIITQKKTISDNQSTIEFNTQSLESGIYFCRIKSGNFMEVKKFLIVK